MKKIAKKTTLAKKPAAKRKAPGTVRAEIKSELHPRPTPLERTPMTEHNPFFVETHYDNADALFTREKEIATLFERNGGTVDEDGQWANLRIVLGVFDDCSGAAKAVAELQAAGIDAKMNADPPALLTEPYDAGYRDALDEQDDDDEDEEGTFLLDVIYPGPTQQSAFESRIAGVIATNRGKITEARPFRVDQRCVQRCVLASFSRRFDVEQAAKTLRSRGIEAKCWRQDPAGSDDGIFFLTPLGPDGSDDLDNDDIPAEFKRAFNAGWDAGYEEGCKDTTAKTNA